MGKIIELNDQLSNLIAAGEVVENMASVVKELVENSIDAKSTDIKIDLLETGLQEIKITDNGEGMSKEDILMCTKRHATSKIKTAHDLYHINTLGFRGEAMPSIASVSHMDIISSEGEEGYFISLQKGEITDQGSASPRRGTIISVKYLFYNTPARLKHLKATNTELSYIVNYINKIALSHPEISFTLTNDQKTLFKSNGTNEYLKVLSNIYSMDIIKNMIYFENSNQYFRISGYLTKPVFNRSTRNHVTLIANNRMIKNNTIINAVIDGYKTFIPIGKYPIVFLKIDLDPLLIDVNIHPQKLEVKFTEERMLHSLIRNTITETLQRQNLIPEIKETPKKSDIKYETLNLTTDKTLLKEDFEIYIKNKIDKQESHTHVHKPETTFTTKVPSMEYIGQYLGTYLIAQNKDGLYIIDQHAAAERIRYEQYKKQFGQVDINITELLIPITLDLSNTEVLELQDKLDQFNLLGITVISNSYHGLDITHVPSYFPQDYEKIYTETITKYILEGKDITVEDIRDSLAKNLSCKHSIKANKYINRNEIDTLLYDLEQCDNPYTCPHGRPTIIKFTQTEVEKMFKRIQ